MKTGLLISTYNSPDFLQLVLDSVAIQSRLPDEVLIADDGSGSETRRVIEAFQNRGVVPVIHCWQPDTGHRKTRILNRAIISSNADYLINIDGDMVLHQEFVSDHCALAQPGRYTQGRRICLNAAATRRHLQNRNPRIRPWERGLNRRPQTIRSRWLMLRFSSVDQRLKNSRGCNQAFWRQDLLDLNGYEERITGWGREDSEICARLHHLGRQRIYARHWAIAWHLDHPERSRARDCENARLLEEAIQSGRVRAIEGIDRHLTDSVAA